MPFDNNWLKFNDITSSVSIMLVDRHIKSVTHMKNKWGEDPKKSVIHLPPKQYEKYYSNRLNFSPELPSSIMEDQI